MPRHCSAKEGDCRPRLQIKPYSNARVTDRADPEVVDIIIVSKMDNNFCLRLSMVVQGRAHKRNPRVCMNASSRGMSVLIVRARENSKRLRGAEFPDSDDITCTNAAKLHV